MTGSSGNSAQGDWNPSHWEDYERVLRGDSADKAFMIAWPKLFYLKLGEIIWVKRDLVKCDWANCYHTVSDRLYNLILCVNLSLTYLEKRWNGSSKHFLYLDFFFFCIVQVKRVF